MREINKNSTYDEAFNVSVKMIKHIWKLFPAKDKYDYDDLYQNCALYFYTKLKNKFSPFDACNLCSKAYRFVALGMLKKLKEEIIVESEYANNIPDKKYDIEQQIIDKQWLESNPLGLKEIDWSICKLLIKGYDITSIGKMLGYTSNTIQFHMTEIRKKTAEYFSIKDYSKMHRRHYWGEENKMKISGAGNPRSKKVLCLKDGKAIKTYGSVGEAARELGFTSGTSICSAIKKGCKSGGYKWKYV